MIDDNITPEIPSTPTNPTIFDRIEALAEDPTPEQLSTIVRIIAYLDEWIQPSAINALSAHTIFGKRLITKKVKDVMRAEAQVKKQETRETKFKASSEAKQLFGNQVIIPVKDGEHEPFMEYLLITPNKERAIPYVVQLWSPHKTLAAPAIRELERCMISTDKESGFDLLIGGTEENLLNPMVSALKKEIETDVQNLNLGKFCRVSQGPFLDSDNGIFHTKSDIEQGVLILKRSPNPKRKEKLYERWKQLFGENWRTIAAHVRTAILNELPTNKHILAMCGTQNNGKTTAATWAATTIEGSCTVLTGSDLDGSWPTFFASRCPIVDDIDNDTINPAVHATLKTLTTSRSQIVPARYTASGLNVEGGYPIFTMENVSAIDRFPSLTGRCIQVIQNANDEIAEMADEAMDICMEMRAHFFWEMDQILAAIEMDGFPKRPGKLRQRGFARMRYYGAVYEDNLEPEEALQLCRDYVAASDDDETYGSDFVLILEKTLLTFLDEGKMPGMFKARDIYDRMRDLCPDELRQMPYSKASNLYEHHRAFMGMADRLKKFKRGNIIGSFRIEDCLDERHHKQYRVSYIHAK